MLLCSSSSQICQEKTLSPRLSISTASASPAVPAIPDTLLDRFRKTFVYCPISEGNPVDHMFLKDVEAHRGDDNYTKAIDMMRRPGPEYPQILHMFSFKMRPPRIWNDSRRRCFASRLRFRLVSVS